ncbi:hypothetical protein HOF92_12090 [bacterium]|nr:hypothetical protein [bacterium]
MTPYYDPLFFALVGGAKTSPSPFPLVLRDPVTGEIKRTGKTNNLDRRKTEHARGEDTKDLEYEVDKISNDPDARTGREQIIYDQNPQAQSKNGGLNKRRPIGPNNRRRDELMEAGKGL